MLFLGVLIALPASAGAQDITRQQRPERTFPEDIDKAKEKGKELKEKAKADADFVVYSAKMKADKLKAEHRERKAARHASPPPIPVPVPPRPAPEMIHRAPTKSMPDPAAVSVPLEQHPEKKFPEDDKAKKKTTEGGP
jgi:hypothetical protein